MGGGVHCTHESLINLADLPHPQSIHLMSGHCWLVIGHDNLVEQVNK